MPRVYFVGCGPGDPDLITVKAKDILERADAVVYSGSLIPGPILDMCRGETHDASGMIREEIFEILLRGARDGKLVVRLHDGDPTIYGAIREQMDGLRGEGVESVIIPGVTSFLAAAAALGAQLTLPGVTQSVIITRAERRTRVPESLRRLAGNKATMVFYLSVHLLDEIAGDLIAGGYGETTPAAVVYRASWSDQKVVLGTLADIAKKTRSHGITKTAIIIVGDVINPESYEYSRLYDKSFTHGYRTKRQ